MSYQNYQLYKPKVYVQRSIPQQIMDIIYNIMLGFCLFHACCINQTIFSFILAFMWPYCYFGYYLLEYIYINNKAIFINNVANIIS
jgi:hypothetical protein